MPERGIDVSEWQIGMDTERVARENGLSFAMVRTNYGANHDDMVFHRHCDGFERAGVIVTPYVYPLASDTRGSIDDAVRIIGGRYDRCIVDWEEGSGGGDHLRAAHERVWEHGLNTPVVYDPTWYWERQGRPHLDWMWQSGRIGGRWKSWYPDYEAGSFDAILRKLASYVWDDSRGGISTRIVQFTSSGRLSGWDKNLDLNYFPGSRAELAALLTGEDDMPSAEEIAKAVWAHRVEVLVGRSDQVNTDGKPVWGTSMDNALASIWGQTFNSTGVYGPSLTDPVSVNLTDEQATQLAASFGGVLAKLPEQTANAVLAQLGLRRVGDAA